MQGSNERRDVTLEATPRRGDGIGRVDGFVIFVPFVLGDEHVEVELVEVKKRYATADELLYDLEYYIYHQGYGPTNETLGKFMREVFGQAGPAALSEDQGKTVVIAKAAPAP